MYTVRVDGKIYSFEQPETVKSILELAAPEEKPLGAFRGGRVLELGETVSSDLELRPITFSDEEGRRIYERSLRFVLLLAARRLFPRLHVYTDNSLGYGVYIRFREREATEEDTEALEREMRAIVDADLPFTRETWTREQAILYFTRLGESDKLQLLTYRPADTFNVYCLDGMYEYFYGAMPPSSGYARAFSVWKCRRGFVMQLPAPEDVSRPAPKTERSKHLDAFDQSNEWCEILGCSTVAELNDMIRSGSYREFIRVNEALQDKAIGDIADEVNARGAKAVLIAGPSSSGKTTFANRLCIHLKVLGLHPVLISLDDFYRNREDLPLEADGKPDLETITALDIPLLKECMRKLLSGTEAQMPRFDFHTQQREAETWPLRLHEKDVLVMEGIHGLNPMLYEGLEPSGLYRIFVTELTCLNLDAHNRIHTTDARLLRRVVRDYLFRGTPPEETLSMWAGVRRGEERWIFPYQEQADRVFNSALHYELPFLRNLAYDMLDAVAPENPDYLLARRLMKILHYMLSAPENARKEVPPLSILREFIGGNTFYD